MESFLLDRRSVMHKALLAFRIVTGSMLKEVVKDSFPYWVNAKNLVSKAFWTYRAGVHLAHADRTRDALTERLAAAACHARLARRRRRCVGDRQTVQHESPCAKNDEEAPWLATTISDPAKLTVQTPSE